jgi:hypothetical protein
MPAKWIPQKLFNYRPERPKKSKDQFVEPEDRITNLAIGDKVMMKILRNRLIREESPRRKTPVVCKHSEKFDNEPPEGLDTKTDGSTGSRAQHYLEPTSTLKTEATISFETPPTLPTSTVCEVYKWHPHTFVCNLLRVKGLRPSRICVRLPCFVSADTNYETG